MSGRSSLPLALLAARRVLPAAIAMVFLAPPARAYNSEEHKLLVDMGAARLRIPPSVALPSPTRFGAADRASLLKVHRDAKHLAVGFSTNNQSDYSDKRKGVQDNSYWYGYGQRDYNLKIHIPPSSALPETALFVAGVTASEKNAYTIGELAALYGDYRRTTHCVRGNCYLTDASAPTLGFALGTDCFGPFNCGWRPAPVAMVLYLRYIANGVVPPFGSAGNVTGNTAADDQYDDAGWWGDEMLRIANVNDWHFSSGALAWYAGMHRLALHYVDLARSDPQYWNHALHYEASALHSFTDLFAFGHVVTNRDRTSHGIMADEGLLDAPAYRWMENALRVGGGTRDGSGRISPSAALPPIADATGVRKDFLASYAGSWSRWGVQELDFHNAFNGGGATVRNLKGDRFFIHGDGAFPSTVASTRAVIAEGVRASLQSLFDAYVELGGGRTVEQIGAAGSPFFAALKSLPVFIESNPGHRYVDHYGIPWTVGDNFTGQWTRYAPAADALAGTRVVPDTSPLPCVIQYVDGDIEFNQLNTTSSPCTTFPAIPSPKPLPMSVALRQNSPNPFDESTTIVFDLSQAAFTRLEVFDLRGAKVATLVDELLPAGSRSVQWDGVTDSGRRARSGLYLYRLTVEGRTLTRMLALVQ